MNFYQTILELEKKTIEVYRDLAQQCGSHVGIRYILTMLADDQEKHVAALSSIREGTCSGVRETAAFQEARKLFEKMQRDREAFSCGIEQVRLYEEALGLVRKKGRLYSEMRDETDCESDKEALMEIAKEEEKQAVVLENIIMMVNRPETWLEDAEFTHLDEY